MSAIFCTTRLAERAAPSIPALTRALLEKGYSAEDIKKIYGGNMLRVMRAVEQRARELKGMAAIESTVDKK